MFIAWILTAFLGLLYLQPCVAELKLVQAIFRHGNRMPTNGETFYPNDPYASMKYEPNGRGGLTNAGKMLSYKLGEYLRDRYDEFLGPTYSKEIIYFRADEIERMVMTGQLVASGLFPPTQEQRWNPSLNWQPIPVWAPPISIDYLYNGIYCQNFKKWINNVKRTDKEVIKHGIKNREVYRYLSKHTGANITQHRTLNLRQILYAQNDIGLKLPEWTKPVFPNGTLDELAAYDVLIRTRTPELRQLLGGVWIREWLINIDNYLYKNDTRKAFLYAAHELTIAPILVVLNNYENRIPDYCDTLMLELHEENKNYYVKFFYKSKDNIRSLRIPGCQKEMCPLDIFRNFVAPVIPDDPVKLCGDMKDIESAIRYQTNY